MTTDAEHVEEVEVDDDGDPTPAQRAKWQAEADAARASDVEYGPPVPEGW